jgi:hypothetical protein
MAEYNTACNFSNLGTPNEVRMRVVEKFSQEAKGRGKQNLASRYTYYVETLSEGNRIYLRRPAFLHNGFDFLVCVVESQEVLNRILGEQTRLPIGGNDILCTVVLLEIFMYQVPFACVLTNMNADHQQARTILRETK